MIQRRIREERGGEGEVAPLPPTFPYDVLIQARGYPHRPYKLDKKLLSENEQTSLCL